MNRIWNFLGIRGGVLLCFLFTIAFIWKAFSFIWGNFLGFDIWFHLKNGQFILESGEIPHKDIFLFSVEKFPPHFFPNYEWLFGVVSYLIFKEFGLSGIETFRCALYFLIYIVLFLSCRVTYKTYFDSLAGAAVILGILFLGFMSSAFRITPRPYLISALSLAALSLIFQSPLSWKGVAVATPIFLVWANCHIEVVFGIVFLSAVLARDALAGFFKPALAGSEQTSTRSTMRVLLPHFSLFGISIAAVLVSPASWHMFLQGFRNYDRYGSIIKKFEYFNV